MKLSYIYKKDIVVQSEAGTSSQRTAVKGKEKGLETTGTRNTAEDCKDMQLDFPLRWTDGMAYLEKFVIFRSLEPYVQGGLMVAQWIRDLICEVRLLNQYTPDRQRGLNESTRDVLQEITQLVVD
ncbi:hypothetical protein PanWU01x14_313310 [Parasponia andersonii]|uniref:Uncharacterized protein n=1 Tax=Parasponia andersonii TaxID=3476 RepID=A0A2P5AP96_PARAD|nr:hypothetical protein PanWU01x14_313310 [Parasponia andersonii]